MRDMAMQVRPSIRRAAPWPLAVACGACIALALLWAGPGRRGYGLPKSGPVFAPDGARHAATDPHGARAGPVPVQGDNAPAFVETDAIDHLDGRRDEPGFALAWHRQQQAIIERQYGQAIASLGLPDGEGARLMALLTARREAAADGRDAAARMGIVGPEANAAAKQAVEELTGEIVDLVGPEAYFGTLELAPTVSACESRLESTVGTELALKGEPLTRSQLYALAGDYVEAAYGPGSAEEGETGDSTGLSARVQALLQRESARVSPAQAGAVRDFLMEQAREPQHAGSAPLAGALGG